MKTISTTPNKTNEVLNPKIQTTITGLFERPKDPPNSTIQTNISPKHTNTLRIISNNINTLGTNEVIRMQAMFHALRQHESDISLLTETKTNSRNSNTWQTIQENTNCMWSKTRLQLSSVPDRNMKEKYQPGGTMTITQGPSLGRVIHNHTDKHGRWTSITFKGKENTKIMVINAYMVC